MKLNFIITRNSNKILYFQKHSHKCFEIVYYHNALGYSNWSNASSIVPSKEEYRYNFSDGFFVIIPPNIFHDEIHLKPTKLIALGFTISPDDFNKNFSDMLLKPTVIFDKHSKIKSEINTIEKEFEMQLPCYDKVIAYLIKRILVMSLGTQQISNNENPINYAKVFLDENFTTSIDFNAVAKSCGYSYDYFRHLFKEHTGLTPKDYLTEKRYAYAKKLIVETSLPLTEISQQCGFSNYLQFNRLFNNNMSLSPQELRNHKSEIVDENEKEKGKIKEIASQSSKVQEISE